MPKATSRANLDETAFQLIDLIYEGATGDQDAWQTLADALSEALGGASIALVMRAPGQPADIGAFRCGFHPVHQHGMPAQLKIGLPWQGHIETDELRSRFLRVGDYFPDEELVQTPFYLDYLKPNDLAPEGPIVHLISPQGGRLASGVQIARKVGGPAITDLHLGMLDRLVPHLSRALDLYGTAHGRDQTTVALGEVIDRMPLGVILLDRDRHPVLMNRLAKELAADDDGFRLCEDGPRMNDPAANERFDDLFRSCTVEDNEGVYQAGGPMSVERPSGLRDYPMMVLPLIQMLPRSSRRDPVCVLFLSDPEWRRSSTVEVLKTLYGLTRAEAELVQLLMHGKSLEEAANERGVTMNTARSQLKQVFAKTETSRQGELLRLLMSGVGTIHNER